MADDIFQRTVKRLKLLHPEVPDREWARREAEWRQYEGGEFHYVKKDPAQGKGLTFAESLAANVPLREALRQVGLKPGTGYAKGFVRRWRPA